LTESTPLTVVLDALAAPAEPALRAWLGPDADDALRAALREHALDWARAAGDGAEPLQLATAAELPAAVADHAGPVILVAPDVPALSAVHLTALRDDLGDGVLLSSGATGDGTPFLIALSHPQPELLALVGASFNDVLATAARLGGALGMLRAERRLSSVGDARALQADPMTPPDLRALLTPLA
jgi:2-phospho-L-lactate guanylyltransferase (CobY/MobA/RfbA family)